MILSTIKRKKKKIKRINWKPINPSLDISICMISMQCHQACMSPGRRFDSGREKTTHYGSSDASSIVHLILRASSVYQLAPPLSAQL